MFQSAARGMYLLAADALDRDLEVERAEARDHELARGFVGVHAEAGILFHQAVERGAALLLGALALGLHPPGAERRRELGRGVEERVLLVGERLSAHGRLQLLQRHDVAGDGLVDLLRLFADDVGDLAEALRVAGARVEERGVGLERAREDARERGAAGVLIDRGLEDERGGGRVGGGRALGVCLLARHGALEGGVRGRRRDEFHDGVEQRDNAARARARGEIHGHERAALNGGAKAGVELFLREITLGEVLLGERVARAGDVVDELAAAGLDVFRDPIGDGAGRDGAGRLGLADPRLLGAQRDHALERGAVADTQLHHGDGGFEARFDLRHHVVGLGVLGVDLGHHHEAR